MPQKDDLRVDTRDSPANPNRNDWYELADSHTSLADRSVPPTTASRMSAMSVRAPCFLGVPSSMKLPSFLQYFTASACEPLRGSQCG